MGMGGPSESDPIMSKILKAIVELLTKLANNSDNLSRIVEILSTGINVNLSEEQVKNMKPTEVTKVIKQNASNNNNFELESLLATLTKLAT
jgi:hypothetical protein